jgi:DNA-directed RNA polymerase specialized sigma24 family protein
VFNSYAIRLARRKSCVCHAADGLACGVGWQFLPPLHCFSGQEVPTPGPRRQVLRRQALARAALSTFRRVQDRVSTYFMEGFTYQETAEIVGRPVGTVRSRLHRGRRVLRKVL